MKIKFGIVLLLLLSLLLSGCSGAKEEGQLRIIDIPLTQESYAFGVDPNQPFLLDQVNAFIGKIQEDGTLERICNTYFGGGEPTAVTTYPRDPEKDQLIVATNAMFAPFEYTVGNAYYGIDMELAAELAEYLDQELVIVDMDFDGVCLSVGQGKCDIAMAGLTVNESRKEHVVFCAPYYEASQRIIVAGEDTRFHSAQTTQELEALLSAMDASVKAGVQTGTTGQSYLTGDQDWGFPGYDVSCKAYQSLSLAVQDMLNGNLDFVVADEAPAEILVQKLSSNLSLGDKIRSFRETLGEQGGYSLILLGLRNTLLIAVLGLLMGIVLGTLIATARIIPQYKLLPRILNRVCSVYVGFFRGTPIVVQLLLGYYVLLPLLGLNYPPLMVCIVIFGLNSAAYVSEIMRGGIGAVDRGQLEAGRALGLSFATTMVKIVIPQAVKNILPTLGNEFISLIKETSVVSFVSAVDIYKAFNIMATNSYEYIVPYLTMAVIYILLIALISLLVNRMERRLARSDKGLKSK